MEATRRRLAPLPLLALLLLPASGAGARPQADEAGDDEAGAEVEADELPQWTQEELDRAAEAEAVQDSARRIGTWDDAQRAANEGTPTWGNQDAPSQPAAPPPGTEEQPVPDAGPTGGDVRFDDFHSSLSRDGTWVETPEYGWVWVPHRQHQVREWRPYLYGRWVWTRHGWTWASDEPFGWATYHYGRWAFAAGMGWYWVPGYTWGPAWVAWRFGDAAVGWAPLYPGYVAWGASYPHHHDHWVYVSPGFFYDAPIHQHCYPRARAVYYHGHTHWARPWRHHGHRTVYVGPRRTYVTRHVHRPVRTAAIVRVHEPGATRVLQRDGRTVVNVYRPRADRPSRGAVIAGSGLDRSLSGRRGEVRPRRFTEAQKIAPRGGDRASRQVTPRGSQGGRIGPRGGDRPSRVVPGGSGAGRVGPRGDALPPRRPDRGGSVRPGQPGRSSNPGIRPPPPGVEPAREGKARKKEPRVVPPPSGGGRPSRVAPPRGSPGQGSRFAPRDERRFTSAAPDGGRRITRPKAGAPARSVAPPRSPSRPGSQRLRGIPAPRSPERIAAPRRPEQPRTFGPPRSGGTSMHGMRQPSSVRTGDRDRAKVKAPRAPARSRIELRGPSPRSR